jgi:hypothetical protein
MIRPLYWQWSNYFTSSDINEINSAAMAVGFDEPQEYKGIGKNCDTVCVKDWNCVPSLHKFLIEEAVSITRGRFGYDVYMHGYPWHHNIYRSDVGASYPWHDDFTDDPFNDIKMTCIVNVSTSDYEGGDFYLSDGHLQPIRIPEIDSPGSAIMFPSRTPHKVDPVTRGERSTVVLFLHGPYWR